jgi:hypothetical protein
MPPDKWLNPDVETPDRPASEHRNGDGVSQEFKLRRARYMRGSQNPLAHPQEEDRGSELRSTAPIAATHAQIVASQENCSSKNQDDQDDSEDSADERLLSG